MKSSPEDLGVVPSPAQQLEGAPLFRMVPHDAPPASQQAAVDAQDGIVGVHQALIMKLLTAGSVTGYTSKELSRMARREGVDLTSVQITRRVWELRNTGQVFTLDGLADKKLHEKGHSPHDERREGCHVVVLAEHHQAAVVLYKAEAVRREQLKLAQRISA